MSDKPGIKTTEFWLVMLGFALTVLTGLTVIDGVIMRDDRAAAGLPSYEEQLR